MKRIIISKSVINGWQSAYKDTGETFCPAFNKATDLWKWQHDNLK